MDLSINDIRRNEEGFTLVELAVVMIIIGLLIGGILKGQELITNARVTSTASTMESFGAAYNGFRDQYNAIPGDMINATARIGACGNVTACVNGSGNGILGVNVGAAAGADEGVRFFGHLLAADFITGMDGSDTGAAPAFGVTNPTAPIGGGFTVGDTRTGVTGFTAADMRASPYIVLNATTAAVGAGTGSTTDVQAANIDRRLDDGSPNSGTIIGQTAAGECVAAVGDETYSAAQTECAIAYRLQ